VLHDSVLNEEKHQVGASLYRRARERLLEEESPQCVTVEHVNRLALLQTRHYLSRNRQAQSLLGAGMVRLGRPRYRPVTYATERATDTTTKTRIYSNAIMSLLNEPAAPPKAYRLHLASVLVCSCAYTRVKADTNG
jgi:hypothetical protein